MHPITYSYSTQSNSSISPATYKRFHRWFVFCSELYVLLLLLPFFFCFFFHLLFGLKQNPIFKSGIVKAHSFIKLYFCPSFWCLCFELTFIFPLPSQYLFHFFPKLSFPSQKSIIICSTSSSIIVSTKSKSHRQSITSYLF